MPHAIAVALLANYFPIFVLFLESMKRSFPDHPEIVVCQKGFSPAQIEFLLKRYSRLRIVDITQHSFLKGPAMLNRTNYDLDAFYARFLLWTDVFAGYENVLYLDTDIFVTGSLDTLFASPELCCFEESYSGPKPLFYDANDPDLLHRLREDRLTDLPERPGNAGVLLVPRRYRTAAHLEELRRLLDRYSKDLIWGDQSLINLWMASLGIRPIHDYRFNFQVRLLEQSREKAAYRDVRIFHMNGWNHLPCTEYMIHVSFFFFFTLPAGRRLYPSYIRLMIREDNLRLKFGIGTFVRWTELFRRICWHLRRIPRAILYA